MKYVNPAAKVIADGKRAMAKVDLTTSCLKCHKEFKRRLSWFYKGNFKCPDRGGDFDQQPLNQMTINALENMRKRLRDRIGQ